MTIFECSKCKCCGPPCRFVKSKESCLKATFSGFDATALAVGCTECQYVDTYSLILRRDETARVTADAVAVRPVGSGGGGDEADFEVTLEQDEFGLYYVHEIELLDGGSGYPTCTELMLTVQHGYVGCPRPIFHLEFGRAQPVLSASASLGTGAQLTVVMAGPQGPTGEEVWHVGEVTVQSGGAGYQDGDPVTFAVTKGVTVTEAEGVIRTNRMPPYLDVKVNNKPATAADIVLLAAADAQTWSVTSVQGLQLQMPEDTMAVGDPVTFHARPGETEVSAASGVVASIDELGAATVTVTEGGAYFVAGGIIASVDVTEGGEYYRGGAIQSVSIVEPGIIVPLDPCRYDAKFCSACVRTGERLVSATLEVVSQKWVRLTVTNTGAHPANYINIVAVKDNTWDGELPLVFSGDDIQVWEGCSEKGEITVVEASCEEQTQVGGCDPLPDQIELELKNYDLLTWVTGIPFTQCQDGSMASLTNWHCNECQTTTTGNCSIQAGGNAITDYLWVAQGSFANKTYVLDRVWPKYKRPPDNPGEELNCEILYEGYVDISPLAYHLNIAPFPTIDCNTGSHIVQVTIAPVPCTPRITIAPPSTLPAPEYYWCEPANNQGGCFAASAAVTGVENGAVTQIEVLSGGRCYARRTYAYRAPASGEVTVSVDTQEGEGATFTVTEWAPQDGVFRVAAISVSGGDGYADDEIVRVRINRDAVQEPLIGCSTEDTGVAFYGRLRTEKEEPEGEFVPELPGADGVFEIEWEQIASEEQCYQRWKIASVTVSDGGSGYLEGGPYTIELAEGSVQESAPSLIIKVEPDTPVVTAQVVDDYGVLLSVSLYDEPWGDDGTVWRVGSISVTDGGAGGCPAGTPLEFGSDPGYFDVVPEAHVQVDGDGKVVGVVVTEPGYILSNTGPASSVEVEHGGVFYKQTGRPSCVIIDGGGLFMIGEPNGVESQSPAVEVFSPCQTREAVAQAIVDVDPDSETFGSITAINVVDGGEGYTDAFGWVLTIRWIGRHRTPGCGAPFCNETSGPDNSLGTRPAPNAVCDPPVFGEQGPCCPPRSFFVEPGTRVTTDVCPESLLNRTYQMAIDTLNVPLSVNCPQGKYCYTWRQPGVSQYNQTLFVDFGAGDIECTIRPA